MPRWLYAFGPMSATVFVFFLLPGCLLGFSLADGMLHVVFPGSSTYMAYTFV